VTPSQAEALVAEGTVRILDVRTPEEYEALGHIPGAMLLPVDLIAAAPATLPREGPPILVYCEHGVRSQHAADVLSRAGFADVLNLSGGMARWRGPREHGAGRIEGASPWLLECVDLLPRGGRALDVACGAGRHALLLASAGFEVRAVDRDAEKIDQLAAAARRLGLPLEAEVLDLERPGVELGEAGYALVVVVHYLHRPLFPALLRALAPGGLLLYETFTLEQAQRGKPSNPEFLLEPGELPSLVAGLEVLREREGDFEGRSLAAVAARRGP
jgi:rhodanese-related sulfurtransferase